MDELTLTLRLHDPKEKDRHELAASWVTLQIPREDLKLTPAKFARKHLVSALAQLEHFQEAE